MPRRPRPALRLLPWLALLGLLLPGAARAQVVPLAEGGARWLALGRATTAEAADVWGHANPAAWAGLERGAAALSAAQLFGLSELRLAALAVAQPTPYGTFAVTARTFGFEDFRETGLGLGYARAFALSATRAVRVGLHVRWIQLTFGGDFPSSGALAATLGVQAEVLPGLDAGLFAQNLHQPDLGLDGEPFERSLSLGLAYHPAPGATVLLAAEHSVDAPDAVSPLSVRGGLEVLPVEVLSLRAGFATAPTRFTGGIGVQVGPVRAGVAAERHETLDWTPAFELGVRVVSTAHPTGAGRWWAVALVALALAPAGRAQQAPADSLDTVQEAVLENLTDDDVSGDPTELLELLQALREDPVEVNTAAAADFAQIPALTPAAAEAIVAFRVANGPFGSLPELQLVPGISEDAYLDARPYLTIGRPLPVTAPRPPRFPRVPTLGEVTSGLRVDALQRLTRRLDLGRGFSDDTTRTTYAGSPERFYTRIQARYKRNLSLNVTLEKDPGEAFAWDPDAGTYGYDYVSFHAALFDVGRIDALVLGDFVAEFGQGLTLWRASGFAKGREPIRPLVKRGRGVRAYGSTDENQFFRGAGLTVAVVPGVYLTGLASRRSLDASVVTVPVDTTGFGDGEAVVADAVVTGLGADGLHRTPTELGRKDALGETLVGGAAEWRPRWGTFGVVGYHARFDAPIAPGDQPYERFGFAGREATMASVYGSAFWDAGAGGAYSAFGEVARAPGGALGGLVGLETSIGVAEALVLVRAFPRDFVTLHGYPFGERNGVGQNEEGYYVGLRLRPAKTVTVSGFFDQYRFPWLRFTVPRPARGHEALVAVEHRPRRWLAYYVQARTETRERGDVATAPTGATLGALAEETRQTLRLQGEYVASRTLRFRARVEGSRYARRGAADEAGWLLFQDARWRPLAWLQLDGRVTLFRTDGFGARLYQFENDLTGVFANTLLSGEGVRAYAMVALQPGGRLRGLDARVKLAVTRFNDRFTVGTGLGEVEGNRVRDLGLQLRYRF